MKNKHHRADRDESKEKPTRFIRAEEWQNNVDSAVTVVIMGLCF